MDRVELNQIQSFALVKATFATVVTIKTIERAICLRGGFMDIEDLYFDNNNNNNKYNEDDQNNEHILNSFLKRISSNKLRESNNKLRKRVDK